MLQNLKKKQKKTKHIHHHQKINSCEMEIYEITAYEYVKSEMAFSVASVVPVVHFFTL